MYREISAYKTAQKQERWRQRQINTFYRSGRPIFGGFNEITQKPNVPYLDIWSRRVSSRSNLSMLRTYDEKYKTATGIFDCAYP